MKTSKPRDPRYSRVRFVHILLIFLVQLRWFFSISNECRVLKSSNKNNFLQLYYIMTLLQNFANFTKKHLPQVHFLVKIHGYACNLFQRKTPQQVFSLQILRTFTKPLFYRAPQRNCFWVIPETLPLFQMLWNGSCSRIFTATFQQVFGGVFKTLSNIYGGTFWRK